MFLTRGVFTEGMGGTKGLVEGLFWVAGWICSFFLVLHVNMLFFASLLVSCYARCPFFLCTFEFSFSLYTAF